MRLSMIAIVVAVLGLARIADAQPVRFALKGDVPIGQRPQLDVTATDKLSDVRVELARDDGKKFTQNVASIAKGQTVAIPVGDGAAGRASYKGTLSATVGGKRWTEELTFDTIVRGGPLKLTYDADHLDLGKRVLQFKASRPAATAELTVFDDVGEQVGSGRATYKDAAPDSWLSISWTQEANAPVMTLKLRVTTADGSASNVELIPWSVTIDHEDVNFKTDSARIERDETSKLDASFAKITEVVKRSGKLMKMRLYIAGHTDTVGPTAKNRKLSMDRAAAIAQYFRKKGVTIPISVAGFGEDVLKVQTADDTDERANRRVDYVIGPAAGAPPFKGPYLKVRADWKQLR